MTKLFESTIEEYVIELLKIQGYEYLSPEAQEMERPDLSQVVLKKRLKQKIDDINPGLSEEAKDRALQQVLNLPSQNLIDNNEAFHRMLTDGIEVEVMGPDGIKGDKVWLVDFKDPDDPGDNEFLVCNQFTVIEGNHQRRPDVVLFVNGLPLVVIELKNPADENATIQKAYTQLQNYTKAIPSLFYYNEVLVASDGLDALTGTISSEISRFLAWKSSDGYMEDKPTIPQIETLIKGMLNKKVLLDLIRHFIVYEKSQIEDVKTGLLSMMNIKKIAAYHQYYAVNKAIKSTLKATDKSIGDSRIGVVWHTQGSGKSLTMVFYTGKVVLALNNPTILVINDRNDLDEQLFDTFAGCKQLLRQDPVLVSSQMQLKESLKVSGGGVIFTTIQKFFPDEGQETFEQLSDRQNIVVIADEAHRSQYGLKSKTRITDTGVFKSYGFAKYIRDALPNASFIGFTGTPIEKEDRSTRAVFGDYIDIYDISRAVGDGATVRIYYESRLAKIHLKDKEAKLLDDEVAAITEGQEATAAEKAKAKWTKVEAVIGHPERLKTVTSDMLSHFEERYKTSKGKGMIVCMSRRIAVEMYKNIINLHPDWHDSDIRKGAIKVVMTSSSSDPEDWQLHNTSKQDRKLIGERFKKEDDDLKLVIVCDMWLTGFDVPCLRTMYIDKPLRGHTLMQAIARVNRVFENKTGGLIVDYIGIATELKAALNNYTINGGKGEPVLDQEKAVEVMIEKFEIVGQVFDEFNYRKYFKADTHQKLTIILEAQDYIVGLKDGKDRYIKQVTALSKAFALAIPHKKALEIRDDVGFFQVVKARLTKFEPTGSGKSDAEMETAIRQLVDKAVVSDGIIDVFDAAGIKKPDISILSDEFMTEVKQMDHKNLAMELLKKLLNDEIKTRTKRNVIQSRKLSEMLEAAINRYQNNLLTTAQIIDELIDIAKEIRESDSRGTDMGLTLDEVAFYDALANNESAREVLGNSQLVAIAREVYKSVKGNATIDWNLKETVRARLRRDVKRILNRYGYPPDMQLLATDNVLKQAELMANELND